MIQVKSLTKYYGAQTLFSDISFTIGDNEHLGLIGRNGTGKTTLLKIILSEEGYDEGTIEYPEHCLISALTQHLSFSFPNVLQEVCSVLPIEGREEQTWKAKSILMGLGFLESDFSRSPQEFSGGYQIRIRLAQALVKEPDLLLLDEPTNYLDIISLRWLEGFLREWKKSFLLVTHDVHFMEKVVESTMALHRGKLRKMKGGPLKIMEQIRQDEEVYEKTRQNQEKKKAAQEEFIRTFRAGARSAGLVQSRIKSLEKQEIKEKLELLPDVVFRFSGELFRGNIMLEAQNISFSYPSSSVLFSDVSLSLHSYDRLAIVGPNGKGKTTLLNLLAGKISPSVGIVRIPPTLRIGYLGSESFASLHPDRILLEEIVSVGGVTEQDVRRVLGSLLFSGETVKKKIRNLSGGEKNRACMAKILLSSHHVLILDEPTNHLDMESCMALQNALLEFEGAIILVSHDERMLSAVANRLVVFDGGVVQSYSMGYDEFLKTKGWAEEVKSESAEVVSENKQQYLSQKEHQKRQRFLQSQAKKIEASLTEKESKIQKLSSELVKASMSKKYDRMKELGIQIKNLQEEIEETYRELENVINEIE